MPVYSCLTAAPFPEDPNEIRMLARNLWHKPVLFRETVQRLYADGVRLFIDVGPGAKLAGYALDTLRGKNFSVSSVSPGNRSSVSFLLGTWDCFSRVTAGTPPDCIRAGRVLIILCLRTRGTRPSRK